MRLKTSGEWGGWLLNDYRMNMLSPKKNEVLELT